MNTDRPELHDDLTHSVPKLIVPRIAIKWKQFHSFNATVCSILSTHPDKGIDVWTSRLQSVGPLSSYAYRTYRFSTSSSTSRHFNSYYTIAGLIAKKNGRKKGKGRQRCLHCLPILKNYIKQPAPLSLQLVSPRNRNE
jgi:hypothetical protein